MYYIEDKDFVSLEDKKIISTIILRKISLFLNKDDENQYNKWLLYNSRKKCIRVNKKINTSLL